MTVERAFCHKLMLEAGLTDGFDRELDELLEQEEPLSDLTLDLCTCGGDRNKQLHILNEYIRRFSNEKIDSGAVFFLVSEELLTYYEKNPGELRDILRRMHFIASSSGFDAEEPWYSMFSMCYLYDDVEFGGLSEEKLREALVELLRDGAPIFEPVTEVPQQRQNTLHRADEGGRCVL